MYTQKVALLVIVCSFLTTYGVRYIRNEELDMDKEFQQLQKPRIATIQNEFGDIYDCVDFYSQPAFDHPLLKNHSFHPEMRPSSSPAPTNAVHCDKLIQNMELKGGGCPRGTVPIRRINKTEFYDIKRLTQKYTKSNTISGLIPGTHVAILQTNSDAKTKYYGAAGELSVHYHTIESPQYTSAEFIIQNGDDKIKVGWTVNPTLNKDSRVRLFQYLDAGQSHCFNTLCPGFVNIRQNLPIDAVLNGDSQKGGNQRFIPVNIFQDDKTGHWWLVVCYVNVGFWPKQIFSSMTTSANYIAVGGEVYGPPGQPLPPMGNGYYPVHDMTESAYCSNFRVLDENHSSIDPQQTETYSDDWHYGVYDGGVSKDYGRLIYYGGTTLS